MSLLSFPLAMGPTTSASGNSEARVLRANFGDGYSQRVADGINAVRQTYEVTWEGLDRTDAQTVDTFLRNRGGHEAFLWTAPGGTLKAWTCERWRVTHATATLDDVAATFVEVFDQTS